MLIDNFLIPSFSPPYPKTNPIIVDQTRHNNDRGSKHFHPRSTTWSILYLEAVSGLAVFAIFMAGWGSGSKYSMLGGFRNIAKMIGYEIPLGISIISVAIMAQSLDIVEIVEAQDFLWNIIIHPLAFIVFGICLIADVGRIPFDQTESEEEIIAGWATEYSGMRWGLAFFAEYLHAVVGSFMVALIFLGGWNGLPIVGNLYIPGIFWLIIKTIMVIMFFIWTRAALPRYRILISILVTFTA
ncbi:MAG: NADH-quinone oxidoreductase subunit H [Candidatus Methanomarinus sp.]|nr:MAG: NADH-quinone oxidoreductase subunit H [ANME-2 cluster archaeon]